VALTVLVAVLIASRPATKALDPDPFPCRSLRHAVYAAVGWPFEDEGVASTQTCGAATRPPPGSERAMRVAMVSPPVRSTAATCRRAAGVMFSLDRWPRWQVGTDPVGN
jgi:hypothetical protein